MVRLTEAVHSERPKTRMATRRMGKPADDPKTAGGEANASSAGAGAGACAGASKLVRLLARQAAREEDLPDAQEDQPKP